MQGQLPRKNKTTKTGVIITAITETETIKQLSIQSAEIEHITKVITDITDQTNLLALGRTGECARRCAR